VHLADLIETTLIGMGYELVELERAPAGLLRVYIDQPETGIVIEDCEKSVASSRTCSLWRTLITSASKCRRQAWTGR
jgi:ribosome maturation factor RimP